MKTRDGSNEATIELIKEFTRNYAIIKMKIMKTKLSIIKI